MASRGPRPESKPPSSRVAHEDAQSFVLGDDGTRLFVRSRELEGAPPGSVRAFFCDGILCDGFIWKYLWNDLASILPLTHWHYRGHGRSAAPADDERIGIAAHAADLQAVRRSMGDPPAVLIGHSMGTQVILETLRRYPQNVRGLVLLCGSFGRVTSTFHGLPILDLLLPKLIDLVVKAPDVARAVWSRIPPEISLRLALRIGELNPEHINPDDILPYMRHMTHVDISMFLRMLRGAGEHSAWDFLPEVRVPVLVVAGERDTFTPPFLAREMARAIPGAELLVVPSGSHVAPIEQPTVVNTKVVQFVQERVLA